MSQSDNYALMHEWLISNSVAPAQIVNDIVMALAKRKLSIASDGADQYAGISDYCRITEVGETFKDK